MSFQGETKENTTSNDSNDSDCHAKVLNHASMSISELQHHLPALFNQLEYIKISIHLELTKNNFVEVQSLSTKAIEVQDQMEKLEAKIQAMVSEHAKNWIHFKITSEQLPKEMLLEIFSFLFVVESPAKYLSFENRKNFNNVRWCCRRFKDDLPPLSDEIWCSFPHPDHVSLDSLTNCLNAWYSSGSTNLPKLLFIENGIHKIEDHYDKFYEKEVNIVNINIPISIVGESREHCIVMGGLLMEGGKEKEDVNVSNLTLRGSNGDGVNAEGASIHLNNVSVENSEYCGVSVWSTKRSTMKNCNVSHSKRDGLGVYGGLMTIDGNGTTVHHNCTNGDSGHYGLHTLDSSSSIHFASSFHHFASFCTTVNNGGGGNHGGEGTIAIVDNEGTVIVTLQEALDDF
jgi:hypothetical protein